MEHLTTFYFYLLGSFLAINIPVIGKYIAVANTLIHEASHCIMALFFGGKVHSIKLFSDTSGVATTSTGKFSRIFVSYAGYTGSSLAAIALSHLLYEQRYSWILYSFIILVIISLIFWIRNIYGFCWSISIVFIFRYLIFQNNPTVYLHLSYLLTSIIITQSFMSTITILKLSYTQRKNAGDATNLAKATLIPAIVWGLIFFIQAVFSLGYILKHYII